MQLDVYHKQLLACYFRKNDIDETSEPVRFDEDWEPVDKGRVRRKKKRNVADDPYKLHHRYVQFGVRPDWLIIHHIVNKRKHEGKTQFLIKWKDLGYADCTWEDHDMDIPD